MSTSSRTEIVLVASPNGPITAHDPFSFGPARSLLYCDCCCHNSPLPHIAIHCRLLRPPLQLVVPRPGPLSPSLSLSHPCRHPRWASSPPLCGGLSGRIHVLSLPSGDLRRPFTAHTHSVSCLAVNDDGSLLISASDDGTIAVFPIIHLLDEDPAVEGTSLYTISAHDARSHALHQARRLQRRDSFELARRHVQNVEARRRGPHANPNVPVRALVCYNDPIDSQLYTGGSDGKHILCSGGSVSDLIVVRGSGVHGVGGSGVPVVSGFAERELERKGSEVWELEKRLSEVREGRRRGLDLAEDAMDVYRRLLVLFLREAGGGNNQPWIPTPRGPRRGLRRRLPPQRGDLRCPGRGPVLREDDDYDDLYNDVNVGDGFLHSVAVAAAAPARGVPWGRAGVPPPRGGGPPASDAPEKVQVQIPGIAGVPKIERPSADRSVGFPDQGLRGGVAAEAAAAAVAVAAPPPLRPPVPPPSAPAVARPEIQVQSGNISGIGPAVGGGGGGVNVNGGGGGGDGGGGGGRGGTTTLFVGELHWWTTDADLEAELSKYGPVKEVRFFDEKASGKSKGYCQVDFFDPAAATACKEGMNGHPFHGRPCVVAYASPFTVRKMGEAQVKNHHSTIGAATATQAPAQAPKGRAPPVAGNFGRGGNPGAAVAAAGAVAAGIGEGAGWGIEG
uniref:RRM domain-containing protein n=1 Tax=Ananas comosus var. bracteatus TaxID=296719 RepID=A0A6V7P3B7_ANACO|nr:unnamed protein product [Ananas comosus var. bracteatus]